MIPFSTLNALFAKKCVCFVLLNSTYAQNKSMSTERIIDLEKNSPLSMYLSHELSRIVCHWDSISLFLSDLLRLYEGEFLNDNVIDVYLRFVHSFFLRLSGVRQFLFPSLAFIYLCSAK